MRTIASCSTHAEGIIAYATNRDLQARPGYHCKRDSIAAHLTIVLAALAVSRGIEDTTGWSIRKFARIARRFRTIELQADPQPSLPTPPRRPPAARTKINNVG